MVKIIVYFKAKGEFFMFWMSYSLIILITFTCVLSVTYLYLFKRNHEEYIGFWGFSWVIYTLTLLLDIFLIKGFSFQAIILIKQAIYLFSSLLLLFGTYLFIRKKFPKIWTIFAMLAFAWIGIGAILNFPFFLITLPTSIFLGTISVFTGIMFLQYWQIEGIEKTITGVMFLVWGIHKTYYFYLNPELYHSSPLGYLSEIVLLIVLNFCIFIIYLQKNRASLIQSERLFRLLAENSRDLIYLYRFRPSPRFEYVSPASKKITGYDPEEYYQDANLFTKLVHPEDRPLLDTLSRSKLSPKEPVTLRYLHKDGYYIWTEQLNTPIFNENGTIYAIEGIIRDISERKKFEEQLIQDKHSRRALLTNISHELRTPIASILGFVNALIDDAIPPSESPKKYLKIIRARTHMIERLIQDLFQLAQLESQQMSFNFLQIPVSELFEQMIKKYEWEVRHAGLHFSYFIDKENLPPEKEIIVDLERINQVYSNLIHNAIKNTPQGGTISLRCLPLVESDAFALFQVQDTGNGIAPEDLPHIFERFYKSKNSAQPKKYPSSRLGLAIAKEIIQAHNGKIWAESKLNSGSIFSFMLPIHDEGSDS